MIGARRYLSWATVAITVVAALVMLLPDEAWGRIGGGQNYGRGGGGGGGGGDGIPIELVFLLIRLCIEYPMLGIPLLLVFMVFMLVRGVMGARDTRQVHRAHAGSYRPAAPARGAQVPGLADLRKADPAFSVPVLYDFLILVHRRAHEAIGNRAWEPLAPFVSDAARAQILAAHPRVTGVSEVVVGAVRIQKVERYGGYHLLTVRFQSTRLETLPDGERRVLVDEDWVFRRALDARSLPPDDVQRLGCPSCGASIETTPMGACPNCGTAITDGQLQWQASGVRLLTRRRVEPPQIGFWDGGIESSVQEPTRVAHDLAARMRELQARHPDFSARQFHARVEEIFLSLQRLWSEGRWEQLRPWVTDPMFQSLRFWIEGYTRHGLRNQLTDVKLHRQEVVKVEVDPWYEAITVRIWGSMKDAVVDRSGKAVGGNPRTDRHFSEYWTFLRASGSGGDVHDAHHCPSCNAPLDNVSQAGICGYCGSKITTGRFDWVLSRIDQPEAYRG